MSSNAGGNESRKSANPFEDGFGTRRVRQKLDSSSMRHGSRPPTPPTSNPASQASLRAQDSGINTNAIASSSSDGGSMFQSATNFGGNFLTVTVNANLSKDPQSDLESKNADQSLNEYHRTELTQKGRGKEKDGQSETPRFTHSEQRQKFREALSLPMDGAGPFVPQQMYNTHPTGGRKRYVEEVMLEGPLYFISEDQQYGIHLKDALYSRTKKLCNRNQTVFEGRGPSVSIRIQWPGYRGWSRQIPTKMPTNEFRSPSQPLTLAKLAKKVAKCVQRFMLDRKSLPIEEDADPRWRIGDGPEDIKLDDLILVSIHHVSLGSWQPQLRLVRLTEEPLFGPSLEFGPDATS